MKDTIQFPELTIVPSLGIDLIEVERIARLMTNERFIHRVFTDAELEECRGRAFPERSLAARFAAKEAFAKALGTGIGKALSWKEVELLAPPGHGPQIRLNGRWAKRNLSVSVSITHTKTAAAAVVMIFPNK